MERSKNASTQKACVLTFQEKRESELQKTETITAQIKQLKHNLLDIVKKETALQQDQQKLREDKIALIEKQKKQQLLIFQQEELLKQQQAQQKNLQQTQAEWEKIHQQRVSMPDQQALEKERNTLITTITKQQKIVQQRLELKEQQLHYRTTLQQQEKKCYEQQMAATQKKKIALERVLFILKTTTTKITEKTEQLRHKQEEEDRIKQEIKKLTDLETTQAFDKKKQRVIEKQFTRRKEYYQRFIAQGNLATQQLNSLHQKELLSHDENNPSCPLCEQNLSASRKRFLKTKFIEQKKVLTRRVERLTLVIKKLKSILIDQHTILEQQKKKQDDCAQRTIRIVDLKKNVHIQHDEIDTIKQRIVQMKKEQQETKDEQTSVEQKLKKHLLNSKKELISNPDYKTMLDQYNNIESKLKKLCYNQQKHQDTVRSLQKIEKTIEQHTLLHKQIAHQEERKKQMNVLSSSLEALKKSKK